MAAKPKRVLIVEDALDVARLISSALESLDPTLKIMICPSAEEAMLESTREAVQLLVTDIRLPGISGPELIRKIGARNPAMKVILITGLTGVQIGRQMDGIQAEAFFHKPFEITELIAVAERCLNGGAAPVPSTQSDRPGTAPIQPPKQAAAPTQPARQAAGQPATEKETGSLGRLAKALAELRQNLGARSAVLMTPNGSVIVQSGEFPGGPFEQTWAPPILEALAGQKRLAERMGTAAPESALTLHGRAFDLLIAPVQAYVLALAIQSQSSPLRLALALEEMLRVQSQLEASLKSLQAAQPARPVVAPPSHAPSGKPTSAVRTPAQQPAQPPSPPAPPSKQKPDAKPAEPQDGDLGNLAALFERGGKDLKSTDVNAFWETLAESSAAKPVSKDSISFDKARKLGLVQDLGD